SASCRYRHSFPTRRSSDLRTVRSTIDAFKLDWNRDGDLSLGPLCIKNRLTCKEASGVSGYPKTLQTLLEVKLTGEEATVKGVTRSEEHTSELQSPDHLVCR